MACPSCGYPEMETKVCDEILTYGGKTITLSDMKGDFCPKCGEGVWDDESYDRYVEAQSNLIDSIGMEIRKIRKRLQMTQRELADIVGVGPLTFSRYERGITTPANPLVALLRVMDRHREILTELRQPVAVNQLTTRTVCPTSTAERVPVMGSKVFNPFKDK
jgi:HTH-type transcriptional regulator / antitoxin MqsA